MVDDDDKIMMGKWKKVRKKLPNEWCWGGCTVNPYNSKSLQNTDNQTNQITTVLLQQTKHRKL